MTTTTPLAPDLTSPEEAVSRPCNFRSEEPHLLSTTCSCIAWSKIRRRAATLVSLEKC
jgi:hypothetical protein